MVFEMIRWGRLVQKNKAQRRPRVSKLRAKGLSGCQSSEQQPREPDRGPVGQIKGYSQDIFTKRKRAKGHSTLKHQKGKRQPAKEKQKKTQGSRSCCCRRKGW
jgi:hypothetical protein